VSGGIVYEESDDQRASTVEATNVGIKTMPMTPLAASSTVINLILATGPFSYPYGYTALGPVISAPLLFMTSILAYITATYLVEALSVAVAVKRFDENELVPDESHKGSLFEEPDYTKEGHYEQQQREDAHMKSSEFYVREKIEIGVLCERISNVYVKNSFIIILVIYVYGAVSLKYVTGAISLQEGCSYLFTGEEGKWVTDAPWTYYIGIAVFAILSICFSFGDIENSKTL
jgi:hypothetical protein